MPKPTRSMFLAALLTAACASSPDYPAARLRAAALIDADPAAAAHFLDELDAATRDDAGLVMLRAEALARQGQFDAAARLYRPIAARTSNTTLVLIARRNLASVLLELDQADEAYQLLAKLPDQLKKEPEVQRELGVTALAAGRVDDARTHFTKLPDAERRRVLAELGPDFFTTR